MSDNYSTSSFSAAAKSVTIKSFLSGVLCLIVYMSILLIYRGIADPNVAGYTETTYNPKTKETKYTVYYFEKGEETLPKGDENSSYSPIYGKDAFPEIATQIISLIVFCLMIYDVAWNYGSHQSNAFSFGRTKRDYFESVKLAVCGSFVGIVAYILLLVSRFVSGINWALPVFSAVNSAFLPYLNCFLQFTDKPYAPSGLTVITQSNSLEISTLGIVAMLLPFIIKIIVCVIGYELGFRQISLKDKILYKK